MKPILSNINNLTFEQILKLTPDEQKEYLKTLYTSSISQNELSSFFASHNIVDIKLLSENSNREYPNKSNSSSTVMDLTDKDQLGHEDKTFNFKKQSQ